MSNPIRIQTQRIADKFRAAILEHIPEYELQPDGQFTGNLEQIEADAHFLGGVDRLVEVLDRKDCVVLRNSLYMQPMVNAGLVFNDGAKSRLLSITMDSKLQFRLRTLLATHVKNILMSGQRDVYYERDATWGNFLSSSGSGDEHIDFDFQEALDSTTQKFMVSGGTQHSLGRLALALPDVSPFNFQKVTAEEADAAYENCGFYFGSRWEGAAPRAWKKAYGKLWPIEVDGDHEAAISINKHASLGIPYYARADNEAALAACLGLVAQMINGRWGTNAATEYRRAMTAAPGLVTFMGKTKSDVYSSEKIEKHQLRFYLVMPGHLKLFVQRATQPFASAKISLVDIFEIPRKNPFFTEDLEENLMSFHSAQKLGLTGEGPSLIVRILDHQLARQGWGYLHCGDDTIFVINIMRVLKQPDGSETVGPWLVVFGTDQSNFDLTQREEVFRKIDDRLAQGLSQVDENIAGLWREIRRGRLVNIHQAGVVYMSGLGTSGIPLQSEVNDMIEDVYCQRLIKRLTRRAHQCNNGLKAFHVTAEELRHSVTEVGAAMGLSARLEFVRSYNGMGLQIEDRLRTSLLDEMISFPFLGFTFSGEQLHDLFASFAPGDPAPPRAITVVPQMSRFCVNILYATKAWVRDKLDHQAYDLIRVFGSLLNTGVLFVGSNTRATFHDRFNAIVAVLQRALLEIPGTLEVERVVDEDVYAGEETQQQFSNLAGIRKIITPFEHDFSNNAASLLFKIAEIWDPWRPLTARREVDFAREVGVGRPMVSLAATDGLSWADEMETEDDAAIADMLGLDAFNPALIELILQMSKRVSFENYLNLTPKLLRQTTARNWGRPPPNVAVRNPATLNPVARAGGNGGQGGDGGGGGGGGMTRSQKRSAQRRRQKERQRAGGGNVDAQRVAEETAEHFARLAREDDY